MTNSSRVSVAFLSIAALAGCSIEPQIDYAGAGVVDVSGTVTMDGEPLADATVLFESPDGRFSYGRTDADGRYVLNIDKVATGVLPGPKTVRIGAALAGTEEDAGGARVETVPTQYNKNSELKVEVKPGEDQTFDFDLQSGGKIEQPAVERGEP